MVQTTGCRPCGNPTGCDTLWLDFCPCMYRDQDLGGFCSCTCRECQHLTVSTMLHDGACAARCSQAKPGFKQHVMLLQPDHAATLQPHASPTMLQPVDTPSCSVERPSRETAASHTHLFLSPCCVRLGTVIHSHTAAQQRDPGNHTNSSETHCIRCGNMKQHSNAA